MSEIVSRISANLHGRDFVIGDVHGEFELLERALAELRFGADDRLFSAGDLIDRGPHSDLVVGFLERPSVRAVRGNHEAMLLEANSGRHASRHPSTWGNGSEWWLRISAYRRRQIIGALARLPLAIEIDTERGSVGIVHGDVPAGMDWPTFCRALEEGDADTIETALWGRGRIEREDDSGVAGIGRVFVGHTPQWGGVRRLGNVYAIDTGAVFRLYGGRLTLLNIEMSSAGIAKIVETDSGYLGDEAITPLRPFGSHPEAPHSSAATESRSGCRQVCQESRLQESGGDGHVPRGSKHEGIPSGRT